MTSRGTAPVAMAATSAKPTVTRLSSTSGVLKGGAKIIVLGKHFAKGAIVYFGSTKGAAVHVESSSALTVKVPKRSSAGVVDVRVKTRKGKSRAVAADRYTYVGPPAIKTTSLPAATFDAPYSASLATKDGRKGTWSLSGLPSGLAFSGATITGDPRVFGSYSLTVSFRDAYGQSVSKALSLTVGPAKAAQVAGGDSFTCAITERSTVACWGVNTSGQLGDGATAPEQLTPTAVVGPGGQGVLTGVAQISLGGSYACALTTTGVVYCWGNVPGDAEHLTPYKELTGAVQVAVAGSAGVQGAHACALLRDDTVECWGDNTYGALGDGAVNDGVSAAAVVGTNGVGYLTDDYADRSADYSDPDVMAIAVSDTGSCALTYGENHVYCWGRGEDGELGNGSSGAGVDSGVPVQVDTAGTSPYYAEQIAAGYAFGCGLQATGDPSTYDVNCWGEGSFDDVLGNGSTSNEAYANSSVQYDGSTLTGVDDVASSGDASFACASTRTGNAYCWGADSSGQRGDDSHSTTTSASEVVSPSISTPLVGVASVGAGAQHACAVLTGGALACWGDNSSGELGDGGTNSRSWPEPVAAFVDGGLG